MFRHLAASLTLAAASMWPGVVRAQDVPHEFFTYAAGPPTEREGLPALPEPGARSDGAVASDDAPVYTADGTVPPPAFDDPTLGGRDNGPRDPGAPIRLDDDTGPEGLLRYAATFSPTVAPHKRVGVRDAVVDEGESYALVVRDARMSPVPIADWVEAEHDVFTASLSLRTRSGQPVPVPTPAADTVLNELGTTPPVPARVVRDSADNWYIVAEHDGPLQVDVSVAAPRTAFGGPLPPSRPRGLPDVPPRLARDAAQVLAAIGVSPNASDVDTVLALTAWFGGFVAQPFPMESATGNLYLDISLGRVGVCRHRAHAFVLTALAAGVPARYVFNETHAFAEVQLADGWRRVDLGGAAAGLEVLGAEDDTVHDPGNDPLRDLVPGDGTMDVTDEELRGNAGGHGGAGDGSNGGSRTGGTGRPTSDPERAGATPTLGDLPPGPGDARAVNPPGAGQPHVLLIPTRLTLEDAPERAYRGSAVRVTGRLTDAYGGAPEFRTIDIWLGPADARRAAAPVRRLGTVTSDRDGNFEAEVVLPVTLDVGTWGIYAVFSGDDDYESARTE